MTIEQGIQKIKTKICKQYDDNLNLLKQFSDQDDASSKVAFDDKLLHFVDDNLKEVTNQLEKNEAISVKDLQFMDRQHCYFDFC